jgi:starvation-inducible DNA-binding protein
MTLGTMTKSSVTERLAVDTASAIDLASQLKQAHWVVTGPAFIALHELFDRQAELMRGHADMLAERARQLGARPPGTIREAAAASQLPDFPSDAVMADEIIDTLIDRYDTFRDGLMLSARDADSEQDLATQDLYIEILRSANLQRWFLSSHREPRIAQPTATERQL